jgi:S-adenosylmethionine:tRNA ribosyltransferase-isomerase
MFPSRWRSWDVWTPIAGPPVAFEAPLAGFALDWRTVASMAARGVRLATLTHAAGISSTGDPELDGLLPFDEPYRIPDSTVAAIRRATRVAPASSPSGLPSSAPSSTQRCGTDQ